MLRKLTESSGKAVGYAVEGAITVQDVAELQAELRATIADHGTIRLVLDVDGLEAVEPDAIWQDLKMFEEYVDAVERLAVIGDERWHEWSALASRAMTDARFFEPHDAERAWAWVRDDA